MDGFISTGLVEVAKEINKLNLIQTFLQGARVGSRTSGVDISGYEFVASIASNVQVKAIEALEKASVIAVPCFIGDTVYHIGKRDKKVHASTVKQILITRNGVRVRLRCGKKGVVGKDIFLTEQEAEKGEDKNV